MGMEVAGSEIANGNGEVKVEGSVPNLHEKENGKAHSGNGISEPIKFGSNGQEESAKLEAENASKTNFPKDAADEWPAEPQIHSFYLVRNRTFDDPNLKAKIDIADKEIAKRNQQRSQILDGLRAKRSDRAQVIGQLKSLGVENRQYGQAMDEKINQIKPLKEALGSLRGPNNAGGREREKGPGLCSSEAELNDLIRSLNYRMQHEVIPLTEEKQILREIKQLEGTRAQVIANSAMRAKIQESMGQKDTIQDQVKLIGTDLDEVKKDRQAVRSKIKLLEDELKAVDSDISSLQQELTSLTEKRDKAFETIHLLRKQRDEGNACFYQGRSVLNNAKELAAKKDIEALKELASAEVEKFMSSWNGSKAFRDDYEKRILASLDMRQLSRDGRMRNPNEKPLVFVEQTKPAEVAKPAPKVLKEDIKPPKEQESVPAQKPQKESKKKAVPEPQAVEEEEYFIVEKPKKEKVIDEAKLKESKKQEELEKQKAALERKKKLSEKAAAKAAIRAQKEAEKKQKDRERKLKKKEAASGLPSSQDEATENEADPAEAEEKSDQAEDNTELSQVSGKTKEPSTRLRSRGQVKRRDVALPKAILKKRKATNYWLWAAPAAAVLVVLLAILYKFVL